MARDIRSREGEGGFSMDTSPGLGCQEEIEKRAGSERKEREGQWLCSHAIVLSQMLHRPLRLNRTYSTNVNHKSLYSDIIPAMIPIVLLGSAVYLGLQLTQSKLSHEKYMEEASARLKHLEEDIATLQAIRSTPSLQEKPPQSRWWW